MSIHDRHGGIPVCYPDRPCGFRPKGNVIRMRNFRFVALPTLLLGVLLLTSGCAAGPAGETEPRRDTTPFTFVGRVHDGALREVSGLTLASGPRESFWVHNDSGYLPRLYEVLPGESVVRSVALVDARAIDWEDVDRAPCGGDRSGSCLYVADVGDNERRRTHVSVYRLPLDPVSGSRDDQGHLLAADWDRVDFRYPEGPRNAETLMVHPRSLALYVAEKKRGHEVNLYRVPRAFGPDEPVHEARVAETLRLPGNPAAGWTVTAGDFAPDGRAATLLAYEGILTLCLAAEEGAGLDVESVLGGPRVPMEKPEGLTYGPGRGVLTATGEQRNPPFYRLEDHTPCRE